MAKSIILTGASRGIGLTTLRLLVEKGHNVVTLSRNKTDDIAKIQAENPKSVQIVTGDVSSESDVKAAVDLAIESYGSVDGLILNAGILGPLAKISDQQANNLTEWKKVFDINFFSLLTIIQLSLPYIRSRKGKIIFVSSGAAVGNTPGWSAYNASKAALNSLCRTLAAEEPDITTVALRPGVVRTAMQTEIRTRGEGNMTEADYKKFMAYHEDDTLLKPEVPAGLLTELVIQADSSLSGQFLNWNSEELKPYKLI